MLILWGVLTGITAIVLMLAGGLNALQNTVIVTSAPFLVIIAGLAVSFWKELHADKRTTEHQLAGLQLPARGRSPSAQGGSAQVSAAAESVKR